MIISNSHPQLLKFRTRQYAGSTPWNEWQTISLDNSERMESFNHYPLNTDNDDGGPWSLKKVIDQSSPGVWPPPGRDAYWQTYEGQFTVGDTTGAYQPISMPQEPSTAQLNAQGTTAIARVAPTNPAFSLGTSLGEFAGEGLPMVVGGSFYKERVRAARSAGGEYLNVEFGWLPLIRDIQDFAKTVKDSGRILDQYRKDSGNKIRRGYHFPTENDTRESSQGFFPVPSSFPFFGSGRLLETSESASWFKGAFKYHVPVADDTFGKFQNWLSMADHLLGVKPSPEVVWNIAPWSWAVDWFTNTGDIMTNISNLGKDGLVMQYGYSMMSRVTTWDAIATYDGAATARRRRQLVYKKRLPATPFGFGVDLSTLSPKQVAIMAALGLSKT